MSLLIERGCMCFCAFLVFWEPFCPMLYVICRRWYPKEFADAPKKQLKHRYFIAVQLNICVRIELPFRALEDIMDSIAELKYYRETIFKGRIDTH